MTKMKLFSTIALSLVLAAGVYAQQRALSADIPFDFNVGDTTLSGGKYTVEMLSDSALVVRSVDREKRAVITLSNAATPKDPNSTKLVFRVYGNQYFLSTIEWEGGPYRELPPANLEIQLAKRVPEPKRLEIAIK